MSTVFNRFKIEFVYRIISTVSVGLLSVILARNLEPEQFGTLFLAISVLNVFQVGTKFGISMSTARFISEYKQKDPSQLINILRTGFNLNLLSISFFTFILIISHNIISSLVGNSQLSMYLLVGTLFLILQTAVTFGRIIAQGFELIKIAAQIQLIDRLGRLILAVIFVFAGFRALGALAGFALASLIATIFGFWTLYSHNLRYLPTGSRENEDLRTRIARYSLPLVVTRASDALESEVDILLIGYFLNPLAVAYYSISKQISIFIETPASALGFTLSPSLGADQAKKNTETASQKYSKALEYTLLFYIPSAAGLVLLAEPIILNIFGEKYNEAIKILQVFSIFVILRGVSKISSNSLDYLGRARTRAIIKGATSLLNAGLNIIVIPILGAIGAAYVTVATFGIYTLVNLIIIFIQLQVSLRPILISTFKICCISFIMSLIITFIRIYIGGIIGLLVSFTIGTMVWLSLSYLFGFISQQELKYVTD